MQINLRGMKRIYVFGIILLITLQLHSQDVPEVQFSMITKITATWCPFCGTWGWDVFEELLSQNQDKAIVIANHYSGDLRNQTASDIADNLNSFGQPVFYLNNTNQNITSGNRESRLSEVKEKVDDNYEASVVANTGLTASLSGNILTVNTKTRFFQQAEGEFYLGVYIIEDNVIHQQASRSSMANHKNVMRGSVGTGSFGVQLASGTIDAGSEFIQEYAAELNSGWNTDNIKLATIIWKKQGDLYLFYNGYVYEGWQTTTTVHENKVEGVDVNVFSDLSGMLHVQLELEKNIKDLSIAMIDASGRILNSNHYPELFQGEFHIAWPVNHFSPGIYYLIFSNGKSSVTKSILLP